MWTQKVGSSLSGVYDMSVSRCGSMGLPQNPWGYDLRMFHTEIGLLFQALQYRKDRTGLRKLIGQDERYRCIDADTLEMMSVMLELPSIWKERGKYREKIAKSREGYAILICEELAA